MLYDLISYFTGSFDMLRHSVLLLVIYSQLQSVKCQPPHIIMIVADDLVSLYFNLLTSFVHKKVKHTLKIL